MSSPSIALLLAQLAVATPPPIPASAPAAVVPPRAGAPLPVERFGSPADSVFEYSTAYYTRLDIHRFGSYAMLPLFAFQYLAGQQLFDKSSEAPAWAREGHGVAATAVAGLFTVNTITGVWNLWEGRRDPKDRRRKLVHAVLMLAADAGFAATGLLADEAEESASKRSAHRTVALVSVGAATVGYLSMLDLFR